MNLNLIDIKKIMITLLVLSLIWLLMSCGSRKVEIETRENLNIENTYSEGEKIVLGNTFTYTPVDALKPMQIEGKTYHNVIITNNKDKIVEKWKTRNITKTVTIEKTKQVERKSNPFLPLLWLLIPIGLYLLYKFVLKGNPYFNFFLKLF